MNATNTNSIVFLMVSQWLHFLDIHKQVVPTNVAPALSNSHSTCAIGGGGSSALSMKTTELLGGQIEYRTRRILLFGLAIGVFFGSTRRVVWQSSICSRTPHSVALRFLRRFQESLIPDSDRLAGASLSSGWRYR